MAIRTLSELRTHLQWAIEIEHSTIPAYLYALYSLVPVPGPSPSAAASTIRQVVLEEMLHLGLACNLLNSVGGSPSINSASFIPTYPAPVPHHTPHPPLVVHLQPASVDAIASTFLAIEKPETAGDIPEDDNYASLAQFYAAVQDGFAYLETTIGADALFCGDPRRQVTDLWSTSEHHSTLYAVTDLASATTAINEIVEQGEGTSQTEYEPNGTELAHYWRFNQIVDGTIALGAVLPAATDPSTESIPPGLLRLLSDLFNGSYSLLLKILHQIFNGGETSDLTNALFALMTEVLGPVAATLMQSPIPGGHSNAGPSFEFLSVTQAELTSLSARLVPTYPAIGGAAAALQALPVVDGSAATVLTAGLHGATPFRGTTPAPPARVPDTGRFGRLFPFLPPYEPPAPLLIALGASGGPMDAGRDILTSELSKTIPAGFTYFGQFLDHNITFDADSSLDAIDDPSATINFRSGRIDLEHVYGLGPETQAFQYYDQNAPGKFWIDEDRPYDVPRNKQGTALIADPRNDNTVITTQLHVAFMKFHNAVVDLLASTTPPTQLFETARTVAVWHYQWIVLHDWLPLILKPDVYADIMKNGRRYYHWIGRPFIPIEFNTAAYRLHSLVLERYQLNAVTSGVLFDLRKPFAPLPPSDAIDWSFFFDFGNGLVQNAKRFEAKIVNTFLNMPGPIDNPLEWPFAIPSQNDLRSIAVRNLLRGRAFGLPSGQSVARFMGLTPLTQAELGLETSGLAEAPLWYYILKEGDVQTDGATLGDVGSRIVGEVFLGLIDGDPTSYLNQDPGWQPGLGENGQFTMTDLLRVAGAYPV